MKNNLALLITGLGIGVLLGLSNTPLLGQILIPILTVIISVLLIFSGQKSYESVDSIDNQLAKLKFISVYPIMNIVIGITFGSIIGILIRKHDILSPKKDINKIKLEIKKELLSELLENQILTDTVVISNGKNNSKEKLKKAADMLDKITGKHFPNTPPEPYLFNISKELCESQKLCDLLKFEGNERTFLGKLIEIDDAEIKNLFSHRVIHIDSITNNIKNNCKCGN